LPFHELLDGFFAFAGDDEKYKKAFGGILGE
jgi:hypothetical protein